MTTFAETLRSLGACDAARQWCGDRTAEAAWKEAPRADWMLWLARRLGVDVGWVYAELGRQFAAEAMDAAGAPNWADLLRSGPEVVDARSAGEVESLLRFAAAAADAAAADADYADAAAYACAAAADAADAAAAADYADAAAAAAAARSSMQKRCADMARERIPFATIEAALAKREAA